MSATLFTVEVYYRTDDVSDARYVLRNMTAAKLKEFREVIICAGLMLPVSRDPGSPDELDHWRVVLPWNIKSIDVWKQKTFYRDNDQAKKSSPSAS